MLLNVVTESTHARGVFKYSVEIYSVPKRREDSSNGKCRLRSRSNMTIFSLFAKGLTTIHIKPNDVCEASDVDDCLLGSLNIRIVARTLKQIHGGHIALRGTARKGRYAALDE